MQAVEPKIRVNPAVVCAGLDEEAILLDVDSGVYYGLDGVGIHIWKLLEGGCEESEIMRRLQEEYEVDPAQLRTDVCRFLEELATHRLTLAADEDDDAAPS